MIMSKMIDNFSTIEKSSSYNTADRNTEIKGFARFFMANALLANYDLSQGNAGVVMIDERPYWGGIDLGCSFSYFTYNEGEEKIAKDFAKQFRKSMLNRSIYSQKMFNNFNFLCELIYETRRLNIDNLKTIIKTSMDHISSIYGENFLDVEEVKRALSEKIGIDPGIMSVKAIEDKIIDNILKIKSQLLKISLSQVKEIFPLHTELILSAYLKAKNNDGIDPVVFFSALKEKGVDILNPRYFNREAAVKIFSFPESCMSSRDFILQGIIYPIMRDNFSGASDKEKVFALSLLILLNEKEKAISIINSGFKNNLRDQDGNTVLHYAVEKGDKEIIQLLLSKGESPNIINTNSYTPFHRAVEKSDTDIVISLLEAGAASNIPDKNRGIPIMYAIENQDLRMFNILVDNLFDPDLKELDTGRTALLLAAEERNKEMVLKLLEKGADPNIQDKEGNTARSIAPELFRDELILERFKEAIEKNNDLVVRGLSVHYDHLKRKAASYISDDTSPKIKALINIPQKVLDEIVNYPKRDSLRTPLKNISNVIESGRAISRK